MVDKHRMKEVVEIISCFCFMLCFELFNVKRLCLVIHIRQLVCSRSTMSLAKLHVGQLSSS